MVPWHAVKHPAKHIQVMLQCIWERSCCRGWVAPDAPPPHTHLRLYCFLRVHHSLRAGSGVSVWMEMDAAAAVSCNGFITLFLARFSSRADPWSCKQRCLTIRSALLRLLSFPFKPSSLIIGAHVFPCLFTLFCKSTTIEMLSLCLTVSQDRNLRASTLFSLRCCLLSCVSCNAAGTSSIPFVWLTSCLTAMGRTSRLARVKLQEQNHSESTKLTSASC